MQRVSKASLKRMIETHPRKEDVIGRALVALFRRQTESEKQVNTTNTENNIGFMSCDARSGSITAKYYIKHKTLLDWQVAMWAKPDADGMPRLCKYDRQLNEIALAKEAKINAAIPRKPVQANFTIEKREDAPQVDWAPKMCNCEWGDGEPVQCPRPCQSHIIAMANNSEMSLFEHCEKESGGLKGEALKAYINRYYGHG